MSAQYQVVRRGAEAWEVARVARIAPDASEYEVVGQVVLCDDGLYRVELPLWQDIGHAWDRQPRGYQLPRGALRALLDKFRRAS